MRGLLGLDAGAGPREWPGVRGAGQSWVLARARAALRSHFCFPARPPLWGRVFGRRKRRELWPLRLRAASAPGTPIFSARLQFVGKRNHPGAGKADST